MDALIAAIRNFSREEGGITAIEYGLIAAIIVVAISTGFTSLSTALQAAFTALAAKLNIT